MIAICYSIAVEKADCVNYISTVLDKYKIFH